MNEIRQMRRQSKFLVVTMFLVMNRPTAVRRKLLSEKWFLSRGKYHGTGESSARSFSHITFHTKGDDNSIFKILKCFVFGNREGYVVRYLLQNQPASELRGILRSA